MGGGGYKISKRGLLKGLIKGDTRSLDHGSHALLSVLDHAPANWAAMKHPVHCSEF